jgi:hypothetical protein
MTTPHIFNGSGTNIGVENAQSAICHNSSVVLQVLAVQTWTENFADAVILLPKITYI